MANPSKSRSLCKWIFSKSGAKIFPHSLQSGWVFQLLDAARIWEAGNPVGSGLEAGEVRVPQDSLKLQGISPSPGTVWSGAQSHQQKRSHRGGTLLLVPREPL